MKIETTAIFKKVLTDLDRLDTVTMILEDLEPSKGKLTIDCYGEAWTAYWGSMGKFTISEFINSAGAHYLAGKLSSIDSEIIYFNEISDRIRCDVCPDTLQMYSTEMSNEYGDEWFRELPMTINPKYKYLCRIVEAVKEAVGIELRGVSDET